MNLDCDNVMAAELIHHWWLDWFLLNLNVTLQFCHFYQTLTTD